MNKNTKNGAVVRKFGDLFFTVTLQYKSGWEICLEPSEKFQINKLEPKIKQGIFVAESLFDEYILAAIDGAPEKQLYPVHADMVFESYETAESWLQMTINQLSQEK